MTTKHEDDKVLVFERAGLVFVFNFHATQSVTDYPIPCERPGWYVSAVASRAIGGTDGSSYVCVLSSDEQRFGGHARVVPAADTDVQHFSSPQTLHMREHVFQAYVPTRTALVFARK